jgi:hypothetical protein
MEVVGQEVTLAREIFALEEKAKRIAAEAKACADALAAKETELQNFLVQEGKTSTGHIEGVGVFALKRENYPGVSQERMPTFLEYLRKRGDGGMIVETVPAQTLKRYCKEKIEELTEKFIEDPDEADKAVAYLGLTGDVPAPAELAKLYMETFGVRTFQKISISHTKRGK